MRRLLVILSAFFLSFSAKGQFTNVYTGAAANDGTGTDLRTAFQRLNFADNWLKTNLTTVSNLVGTSAATKLNTNAGTVYALTVGDVTASRAAAFGASGNLTNATTTLTELNQLSGVTANLNGVKTVANLAALKALTFNTNYTVVFVLSDANGFSGSYWWDATIVTADDDGNGIIALNSGTGGFERRGL